MTKLEYLYSIYLYISTENPIVVFCGTYKILQQNKIVFQKILMLLNPSNRNESIHRFSELFKKKPSILIIMTKLIKKKKL